MDTIQIIRSKNRKSVSIQIMPDASITVSVPYSYHTDKIKKILAEKDAWITRHQHIMRSRQIKSDPQAPATYLYLGRPYQLVLRQNQKNIIEFDNMFYLGSSSNKYAAQYLTSWYKLQARQVITDRVRYFAKQFGYSFSSVTITSAQTQWGSCSSDKNLHFNWKIIMAPLPVIDYVVAHELSHLSEMSHSHIFWQTVRKMSPLYREHRTWLNRNGHNLRIVQDS